MHVKGREPEEARFELSYAYVPSKATSTTSEVDPQKYEFIHVYPSRVQILGNLGKLSLMSTKYNPTRWFEEM